MTAKLFQAVTLRCMNDRIQQSELKGDNLIIRRTVLLLFSLLPVFFACSSGEDSALKQKADELAHKYIITDGHIDIPWRLSKEMEDITVRTEGGDFDYVRATAGGLDVPFMSIYVPASYQKTGGAKVKADTLIDMVVSLVEDHPDKFALARSPDEAQQNFENGKISFPMGMENGAPIEGDLANVAYFHGRGIRYITLTHAKDNHICDSSYDTTGTWGGLSPFGREVVEEMNRVGIMIDVSHLSDNTFYQVMEISRAPAIASHSSCRYFTPDWERNMNDDMIRLLAEKGGVIQINFGSSFIRQKSKEQSDKNKEDIKQWLEKEGLKRDDPEAKEYIKKVFKENPVYADVSEVADHFDHVVKLAGINHVGFGSDFDGVGDSLPYGLKDVSYYPNLIYHLLKRGYSEEDIRKICYGNVFRVWQEVERVAQES